ncbi:hypothetical protein KIW84_064310 [Lathyrus oleraceus]|uniref:Uncharacterized protein n=1 Tax=Pisum sativum TaxID=3888 RepID=A0A9D5A5Z1_PEA|nr:hypothetical protein KIW84_064310 [Pisum sativum]
MSYAKLYQSLFFKNLIQPRNPPQIPEPLPWWYKPELRCAFHQGAPWHDIENCYLLKYEVQKLMKSGMVSFEDRAPNVKANPFPAHGNTSVNMVDGCPGEYRVFYVRFIRGSSVQIHKDICMVSDCEHDHEGCDVCSVNPMGYVVVKRDIQHFMDEGMIQICQSRHEDDEVNVIVPVLKQLERLVIQYDSCNNQNVSNRSISPLSGQEVPLPTTSSVVSIADVTKVTRSGRVFGPVVPDNKEELIIGKRAEVPSVDPVGCSRDKSGESSNLKANSDDDEVLRLIKRSELNVVEQLLQTPSKISVMSSLLNSEAHREALQRVLEQAYGEQDVTLAQFDHIVANITSCNNLSFCDEDLPEEGRNHNLDLHISMNLGRPWIHKAGAVTSTLQQKLKFVKNGKLVIVGGEKALLVSHLSSFSYVEVEDEGSSTVKSEEMQLSFRSGGFIHGNEQHLAVVLEDNEEEDYTNFVTHEHTCNNWTAVNIHVILHRPKLVPNPIEYNDPSPSPNFEFPVFEVEEESDVEIELVTLGSEDDVKEVKIGSRLCPDAKKGLIDLLQGYSYVFSWSYQNMPGLDSEIVEHRLTLKLECPLVKQKLRRTHPDTVVKIKEEVQKQIGAGFLVTVDPKDDFPLPHIAMLAGNTAKFKVFSFMDGSSEYNQIKMEPGDMEKTTFITPWGTFCYRVMPFGLKNASATYQSNDYSFT